jgi:hypothetical protein
MPYSLPIEKFFVTKNGTAVVEYLAEMLRSKR